MFNYHDTPPFLLLWDDFCHVRLDPRFPFILRYVEKIGVPGDEANVPSDTTWIDYT